MKKLLVEVEVPLHYTVSEVREFIQEMGIRVLSIKTLEDTTSPENQNKTKEKQN